MNRHILKIWPLLLCISSSLYSSEVTREEYFTLVQHHPDLVMPPGNATKGEIEIILDPGKMAAIEQATGRDVGILKSDSHWIWINDACKFPNGSEGVIGRILAKSLQRYPGAAVLPVLPDGKIVLNCEFRHSTRNWELEMPRGGVHRGETLEDGASREVREETGMVIDQIVRIGEVTGDSGVTGMILPIFMAKVIDVRQPDRDSSEVIQNIILSVTEIEEAFAKGYIEHKIEGEVRRVYARDPFLAYALTVMRKI